VEDKAVAGKVGAAALVGVVAVAGKVAAVVVADAKREESPYPPFIGKTLIINLKCYSTASGKAGEVADDLDLQPSRLFKINDH
jgi:hypothetical protein